jgi:hypothetical protein
MGLQSARESWTLGDFVGACFEIIVWRGGIGDEKPAVGFEKRNCNSMLLVWPKNFRTDIWTYLT